MKLQAGGIEMAADLVHLRRWVPSRRTPTAIRTKRTVSALDTKYQAAVKRNDAATMDAILADDFVVVTGTGRIYTKAELLNMARTNEVIYEHQEEERRLFGYGATPP